MRLLLAAAVSLASATAAAEPDRCAAGLERAEAGRLVAAFLDLEACIAAGRDGSEHRSAHRRVKRALDGGDYARVTLATTPPNVPVAIAPLGVIAATGIAYLAPGTYTLEVSHPGHRPLSRSLEITGRYRETVELVLAPAGEPAATATTVDLTGQPGPTAIGRGKDPEHENLIPERFRAGEPAGPGGDREPRRSRWPYALVGVGLAALGAGVALHLDDREGAATGFYIAGGLGTAAGVTGLLLRW